MEKGTNKFRDEKVLGLLLMLGVFILYSIVSFIKADFNVINWGEGLRLGMALLYGGYILGRFVGTLIKKVYEKIN